MATRLDRLLVILDTGSNPVTRKAAALQLGEVQKLHPHELPNLLKKVHAFLRSKSWDTRVAAAQAVEAIARNTPKWNPETIQVKEEPHLENGINDKSMCQNGSSVVESVGNSSVGKLKFSEFDIRKVLERGEKLLGSAGDEFDVEDDSSFAGLKGSDAVLRQRQMLQKRLGLDMVGGIDMGIDRLVDDEDFIVSKESAVVKKQPSENAANLVAAQIAAIHSHADLSSREKNRAKRRARLLAKQLSKDKQDNANITSQENEPPTKRMRRTQSVVVEQPSDDSKILIDSVAEEGVLLDEMDEWPFENFCFLLCNELFHPSWEVRHGAASALREIVKLHGDGAGKEKDTHRFKMQSANAEWLEDTALKLLCVFALDRFGDYVSDEVVAPVHETCAQTLGAVLLHMGADSVRRVLGILLKLQEQSEWQVRHGGLLGLKYMLAVKMDMMAELLPQVLPWILKGLQDGDDDVRAVAAAALLPATQVLAATMSSKVSDILCMLWEILLDLDDLTASTNSVMNLLTSLLAARNEVEAVGNLEELVPRLWPFFRHSNSTVRASALKTMKKLLDLSTDASWVLFVAASQMQHLFCCLMTEPSDDIRDLAVKAWAATLSLCPESLSTAVPMYAGQWLHLLTHSDNQHIDVGLLAGASSPTKGKGKNKPLLEKSCQVYLGGVMHGMDAATRESQVLEARLAGARALGHLLHTIEKQGNSHVLLLNQLLTQLFEFLCSSSAVKRMSAAMVIQEWADLSGQLSATKPSPLVGTIVSKLNDLLSEQIMYDEMVMLHQRLQMDSQNLLFCFLQCGLDLSGGVQPGLYTLDTASDLATTKYQEFFSKLSGPMIKSADAKNRTLLATIGQMQQYYQKWSMRVQCSVAGAVVGSKLLTDKLNPVIRPIIEGVRREQESCLQRRIACTLAELLMQCVPRSPCPNQKIAKNLCNFVCSDTAHTPSLDLETVRSEPASAPAARASRISSQNSVDLSDEATPLCNATHGIFSLIRKQKDADRSGQQRRGRLSRANSAAIASSGAAGSSLQNGSGSQDEAEDKSMLLQQRGAEMALSDIARKFGERLPEMLPSLWAVLFTGIKDHAINPGDEDERARSLITSLRVLEVVAPSLHESLQRMLAELLPSITACLQHTYTAVRHMASRCMAALSKILTTETMHVVIQSVIPLMSMGDNLIARQGALEAVVNVLDRLGFGVLPYLVLLICPVLGRMSDQAEDVRLLAASSFGTLVQLMPLEAGASDPPEMSKELVQRKLNERRFLEQLLDGSKLDTFHIPIRIKTDLRKYQQDGVNWLAFLNKYNLHGILCDDMGLGKTLQSICIMAGDHYNLDKKYKETGREEFRPLPSLVVCPPTLTGHWCYEVQKFCDKDNLNPLHYTGSPHERLSLQSQFKHHNLIVASYDIVRNDWDFFLSKHWNYCILDEGHIIKNSKTKLSKVIKKLKANHRLILSGTPIQNNVLELWSLFDFLMPGFLGTEKEFTARFGRPILQSRDAKSSSREQEAGALAMEALHKQTLPFMLRRVKEDVLQDLPPKIIQDYYCDLSPLQVKLYEDFARSKARKSICSEIEEVDENKAVDDLGQKQIAGHVFQALQYLRKVCNHPLLALTPSHPEYESITSGLREQKSNLRDIEHSGKMVALKQLLLDCGIGSSEGSSDDALNSVVSQHRALIFCQQKSMLDVIERDLFKEHMPSVTYSRLDGSTPVGSRHGVVQRFNSDPSVDVLLLTTHVGGLGLNLTGADTVIFVEHDWNPMKDLQAMDRAHRIGQKKVVNVYRLISRGTLEEKIMGLQKFKMNIASTVITNDNSSLRSMDTDQLLDLFTVDGKEEKDRGQLHATSAGGKASASVVMHEMGDLWDEADYEREYDLNSFISSLQQ